MSVPFALSSIGLFIGESLIKGLVVLAAAAGITWGLRHRSAALRHAVWTAAFAVLVTLTVGTAVLPTWSPIKLGGPAGPTEPRATRPVDEPVPTDVDVPRSASRRGVPFPLGMPGTTESVRPPDSAAQSPGPRSAPEQEGAAAVPSGSSGEEPSPASGNDRPIPPSAKMSEGRSVWALVSDVPTRRLALWAALFWAGGVCLLLGRLLAGGLGAYWIVRGGEEKREPAWRDLLDQLRGELGLDTSPRLVASADIDVPMTVGGWRPVLLLPAAAEDWPESRRRFALLHELAHIQRNDYLTHLLTQIGCALHWPNPLVWWAARRCRAEREKACDRRVLATGVSGPDYADVLVDFARMLLSSRYTPTASLTMAHPSTLKTRVRHVLSGPETPSSMPARRWGALVGVALCSAVLLSAFRPWSSPETPGAAALGSPDTSNVPRKLAQALLYGKTTDLSVGELPEGLPDDFALPDDARILGGRAWGRRPYVTVIATTERPPEETVDQYGRLLARQGWSRQERQGTLPVFDRRRERDRTTFCREHSALVISAPPRGNGEAYLNIRYRKKARSRCGEDRMEGVTRKVPLPSLQNPGNASVERKNTEYEDDSAVAGAEVESKLSLSELAVHYAGELKKEGWTMISQTQGEQVVRQSWQFEDDSGGQWSGIFLVSQIPGTSRKSTILHITKP